MSERITEAARHSRSPSPPSGQEWRGRGGAKAEPPKHETGRRLLWSGQRPPFQPAVFFRSDRKGRGVLGGLNTRFKGLQNNLIDLQTGYCMDANRKFQL